MKRGFPTSANSTAGQSKVEVDSDCKENVLATCNAELAEEIGLHFSYKSSQKPRFATSSRKGRASTHNRADVMKSSENVPSESAETKNEKRRNNEIKVPKQTRQTTLNFSSLSSSDFPSLSAGSNANVIQPPSGSWAKRAVQNPSGVRSPVTSSPVAKVARASQSSFRKLNLPTQSPLASNRSFLRRIDSSSPEPSKVNTNLFGKKMNEKDATKAPSDYDLNFHKFASDSWADMMDEVDSIKSGNRSFVSMDTSLNTTMDSVESGDLEGLLERRSKQVAFGKNTKEYQFYIKTVPYDSRKHGDPVTPKKEETYSRRAWDGKVRAWKRQIKIWAAPRMTDCKPSAETSLSKILESLPVAEKLNPKSPYKKTLKDMGCTTPTKKKESRMEGVASFDEPSKSPFKRPRDVDMSVVLESPSKRRTTVAPVRSICTRSLAAAMNEDSLLNDEDMLSSKRVVSSARVDESSCSTLVDESSCMSTDGAWTVKRMPMPATAPQLESFLRNFNQK